MISNNKIFTFWNYLPIEDDFYKLMDGVNYDK